MNNQLKKVIYYLGTTRKQDTSTNELIAITTVDLNNYEFVGERLDLIYENIDKTTLIYGQKN